MFVKHVCGAGLCAAAVLFTSFAEASLVLTLDDPTTGIMDVIVVDNVDGGIGTLTAKGASTHADGDPSLLDGVISWSGTIGAFLVNVTTGTSKPVNGPTPEIDLLTINVSGGAGVLDIMVTDTGFLGATTGVALDVGGNTDGTVAVTGSHDSSNLEFGMESSTSVVTLDSLSSEGNAFTSVLAGLPYSLTISARVTHTGPGFMDTAFTANLAAVPEPAAMVVWSLLGMVSVVAIRRSTR